MILVNRAVRSNSSAKLLGRLVIADLPQHGHKRSSTQVCCTRGHDLTHPASSYAVLFGWVQIQTLEHLLSARQTLLISASVSEYIEGKENECSVAVKSSSSVKGLWCLQSLVLIKTDQVACNLRLHSHQIRCSNENPYRVVFVLDL